MLNRMTKIAVSISLAASLFACATSPTGRNQLLLFSSDQLANSGQQAFDAMKSQQKVSTTPSTNRYIECIADAITAQLPDSVFAGEWEVVVFDEQDANAFALPGGKIGVYTGLLEIATTQAEIAAVIGHEVGHVIAQHGNERMSQSSLIGMGQQVAAQVLEANEVANSATIMGALGLATQVGISLPFSRTHESEADLIGLDLMASAGFDPKASVSLWQKMSSLGGARQPELLSTHPAPSTRIQNLQQNMDAALAIYNKTSDRPKCR
ncbi:M48 family metallopeptidase [Glaciecola sp. 1036]|uniref:M48 family metallopeptidase n=1 Tax=Alteromonadaceae TaxID=72275 RepID=UPI003CFCDC10